MAWKTPITDWTVPHVPSSDDFERIEGNIEILGKYDRAPAYAAASGSANAYAITLDPAPTSYYEGMCVAVKINVENTGLSTININGLGAKSITKPNGKAIIAGNLKAGSIYTMRYTGTNFVLQGDGGDYSVGEAIHIDSLGLPRMFAKPGYWLELEGSCSVLYPIWAEFWYVYRSLESTYEFRKYANLDGRLLATFTILKTSNVTTFITADGNGNIYKTEYDTNTRIAKASKYDTVGNAIWTDKEFVQCVDSTINGMGTTVAYNGSSLYLYQYNYNFTYLYVYALDANGNQKSPVYTRYERTSTSPFQGLENINHLSDGSFIQSYRTSDASYYVYQYVYGSTNARQQIESRSYGIEQKLLYEYKDGTKFIYYSNGTQCRTVAGSGSHWYIGNEGIIRNNKLWATKSVSVGPEYYTYLQEYDVITGLEVPGSVYKVGASSYASTIFYWTLLENGSALYRRNTYNPNWIGFNEYSPYVTILY